MRFGLLTLLACFLPASQGLGEDIPTIKRICDLMLQLEQVQVHAVATTPEGEAEPKYEYWVNGNSFVVLETRGERQRAFGRNPQYDFILQRPNLQSEWVISRLPTNDEILDYAGGHLSNLRIYSSIETQRLLDVLPDSGVEVTKTDEGLIRLNFDTVRPTTLRRHITKGRVDLDPTLRFAVVGFDCAIAVDDELGFAKGSCLYDETKLDLTPVARNVLLSVSQEFRSIDARVDVEFEAFEYVDIAPERFKLTSFGLAEPDLSNGGLRWVSGLIIVVVMLFFAVRFLRKEKS